MAHSSNAAQNSANIPLRKMMKVGLPDDAGHCAPTNKAPNFVAFHSLKIETHEV